MTRRAYHHTNLAVTMTTAQIDARHAGAPRFVFATGNGYTIGNNPPPCTQSFYCCNPGQRPTLHEWAPDAGVRVAQPEPETNTEARQQADMFADAGSLADLPLFSGTAPRQTIKPFIPTDAAPTQPKLL